MANSIPTWETTTPKFEETKPIGSVQQAQPLNVVPTWEETVPKFEETKPVKQEPSAYDTASKVRKTEKGGVLASQSVTEEELQDIAQRTGTDANRLREFVPYFGVLAEKDQSFGAALKAIAGHAGKMAFGIPQKLMKMSEDDKYEHALDILGALAGQKQSYFLDVADIVGGPAAVSGRALKAFAPAAKPLVKTAATIAEGTGIGAVAGAAQSEKGQELKGAVQGGITGGVISSVPVAYRAIKGATKWSNNKIQEGLNNIRENSANIEAGYQQALPERAAELEGLKAASKANIKSFDEFKQSADPLTISKLISPEARKAALTEGSNENQLLKDVLSRGGESDLELSALPDNEIDNALAYLKIKSLSKELKRTFGSTLRELQATRPNDIPKLIDELDKTKFALQAVSGKGFEKSFNPLERIGYKIMAYISDSKPYLQVLDDRYGTNFELIADNASKKMNLVYGGGVRKWAPEIQEIANLSKDSKEWGRIVQEVESGSPESPEAQKVSEFFNNVLTDANEQGANIQRLKGKGYFPKIRKGPVEYIRSYRDEANRLQQDLNIDFSELTDESINKLAEEHPDFKSFLNETLRVTDLQKPTALNFKQGFQILNGDIAKARQALNLKAFALQQRSKTELPQWARELDPAKAAQRWVTNTYKFLALKDELAQLNAAEQIARKAKDNVAANYLKNLRLDWMGGRTDTLASWGQKQAERWKISMDTAVNKARQEGNEQAARMYEGAKDLPNLFLKGQNNVYINALGLSPKAAMQNLASFYTQNFPELGHATSIYYTRRALPKLGQLLRKGELGEYVYSKGLIDKDWTGEAVDVLSGNLRKSLARQMSGKAADLYSQAAMAMFKGSELTSRAMTSLMAEDIAKDMFLYPELRNKLVMNMKSSAYRRALQGALEKRDAEGVKNLLTSYLNSNNMYNYNKLNQAEFARSLGPLFSIFSKWPSMAVGTQMKDFLSGAGVTPAVVRNMRLLYVPYATMYLADKVADVTVKPLVGQEREEAIMGKKGLHGMMLTDATPTGVFERGGILASPAVRAANAVAASIVSEEPFGNRFSRASKDLITTYVPVLPLAERVITRDVPRILYNKPPIKNNH